MLVRRASYNWSRVVNINQICHTECMKSVFKILSIVLLIGLIGGLGYGYYDLYGDVQELKESASRVDRRYATSLNNGTSPDSDLSAESKDPEVPVSDAPYYYSDCVDCKEVILNLIADTVSDLPTTQTVKVTETVSVPKTTQTSYVPLGTTASSTSTDWYTIDDSSAFIDLKNDFSKDAYVTFEASLKVKHGNGQAFARLWDDTNNIAVDGSEISTTGNMEFEYRKSGRIYLWNGNNNYKVQLKSLNGFEVTYTNAKVKVVY